MSFELRRYRGTCPWLARDYLPKYGLVDGVSEPPKKKWILTDTLIKGLLWCNAAIGRGDCRRWGRKG